MSRLATARNNPALTVEVVREGGRKRGEWVYRVRGQREIHAEERYPCRDGGNYRDTLEAARAAVASLLAREDHVPLYYRWSGSTAISSFS